MSIIAKSITGTTMYPRTRLRSGLLGAVLSTCSGSMCVVGKRLVLDALARSQRVRGGSSAPLDSFLTATAALAAFPAAGTCVIASATSVTYPSVRSQQTIYPPNDFDDLAYIDAEADILLTASSMGAMLRE
ncbi:hypothetical protein QN239_30920 [Mycolicibacterium sp. Y3]